MSESIGFTKCSRRGCAQWAEFKKDKRGKFFTNCPDHGRDPASTNKAQEEMAALYQSGAVFESVDDAEKPVVKAEKPEGSIKDESEERQDNHKTIGIVAIVIGVIGGAAIWKAKAKI